MPHEAGRLRVKTWVGTAVAVASNVFGNFFMKRGLPAALSSPLDYFAVLFRPYVAVGVALLALWLLSRMALLSWADLSYVAPVNSVGYILVALTARVLLHERIDGARWAGVVFIAAGVSLVSWKTAVQTAPVPAPKGRAAGAPEAAL